MAATNGLGDQFFCFRWSGGTIHSAVDCPGGPFKYDSTQTLESLAHTCTRNPWTTLENLDTTMYHKSYYSANKIRLQKRGGGTRIGAVHIHVAMTRGQDF